MNRNRNRNEKIIVTGGNGFTGRFVCKELLKRKINFSVILRPGKNYNWLKRNKIDIIYADLDDKDTLSNAFRGFDFLINVASLGFGSAENIIAACENAGIKRTVFVSSTSIFTTLNANSKIIRKKAENSIKKSNLVWTIIRPTMIYGSPQDRNIIKLIKWINNFPIIPVFGDGKSLQQPVYVNDVALALVDVLYNEITFYKTYNISGKDPLTFNEVIDLISKKLERKVFKIFIPFKTIVKVLKFFEFFNIYFPLSSEQIIRINEDKSFPYNEASKDFGFDPLSFKSGINKEIEMFIKST